MPTAAATYKVSVQSLPSMDEDFNKTVVSKDVTIPSEYKGYICRIGWCLWLFSKIL